MSEYILREYQERDYVEVTEVINQLFHPLFSAFVKIPFEKGGQFIRDFKMIGQSKNEGLLVMEAEGKIVGAMKLNAKEMRNESTSFNLREIIKKYGFFGFLKTIMVSSALQKKISEDELYVDYLVVDKNYRSLGIGTKFLHHGLQKARDLNKKRFTLNVLDNNPRGRVLYERFGFSFVKESKYPRYVRKRLGANADHRMEINLV